MAFLLARTAGKVASVGRTSIRIAHSRRLVHSDNLEHINDEAVLWMKYSAAFSCVVAASTISALVDHLSHHDHHEEESQFSHMKVRNKPYPWICSDCNFVDPECFKKCKEAASHE